MTVLPVVEGVSLMVGVEPDRNCGKLVGLDVSCPLPEALAVSLSTAEANVNHVLISQLATMDGWTLL